MCISAEKNKVHKIVEGTNNGESFLEYLKSIKDTLKNKTLLLDNAKIHHYKKAKQYCDDNNINLLYLPAYTPEYNPI